MSRSNVSAGPVPTSNLSTRTTRPAREPVVVETVTEPIAVVNKKTQSKRIADDLAYNKSYEFKHPVTGEPVLVRAETFSLALKSFRELIKNNE